MLAQATKSSATLETSEAVDSRIEDCLWAKRCDIGGHYRYEGRCIRWRMVRLFGYLNESGGRKLIRKLCSGRYWKINFPLSWLLLVSVDNLTKYLKVMSSAVGLLVICQV
jgi:hypothetical protein